MMKKKEYQKPQVEVIRADARTLLATEGTQELDIIRKRYGIAVPLPLLIRGGRLIEYFLHCTVSRLDDVDATL